MSTTEKTLEVLDRSHELTFDEIDHRSAEVLLSEGVLVVTNIISVAGLEAVGRAYDAQRRHDLPRRLAARVVGACAGHDTKLYDRMKAKPVQTLLDDVPKRMTGIMPVVEDVRLLNQQLFSIEEVRNKYGTYVPLNVANIGVSREDEAFTLHQDSQGCTGLGYAVQPSRTRWEIYHWRPSLPLDINYIFHTNPGDVVILTQREGPRPQIVDDGRGFYEFEENGSLIHRGVAIDDVKRNALAVFYQD